METRSNHFLVGSVVLALLAAVLAFAVWIAGLSGGHTKEYDIFFRQSVEGLAKGSSVTFAGVPSGQVQHIELWRPNPEFVRVRIAVDDELPVLIGTTASIQGVGFTGVSQIQLSGAVQGAPPITEVGPAGVPTIPTRSTGLGALLNNAPQLVERLSTLTERLTTVFSDKNQASIEHILANTDRMTSSLAKASPQVEKTLVELQGTLAEAKLALGQFETATASTNELINGDGKQMMQQFRATLKSIDRTATSLEALANDTRPAARQLSDQTIPQAEAAIRDLRATTKALRDMTERLNDQGASAVLGGQKLPDYKP